MLKRILMVLFFIMVIVCFIFCFNLKSNYKFTDVHKLAIENAAMAYRIKNNSINLSSMKYITLRQLNKEGFLKKKIFKNININGKKYKNSGVCILTSDNDLNFKFTYDVNMC